MFLKALPIRAKPLMTSAKFQSKHISNPNATDTRIKIATLPCFFDSNPTFIIHPVKIRFIRNTKLTIVNSVPFMKVKAMAVSNVKTARIEFLSCLSLMSNANSLSCSVTFIKLLSMRVNYINYGRLLLL
jgi:hypothetical protein